MPTDDGWLHEPKLDGYRLQLIKEGRTVRLYSRRGKPLSKKTAERYLELTENQIIPHLGGTMLQKLAPNS